MIGALRRELVDALPAHSLRGRLARGAFWTMAGTVLAQGITATAAILVARILGRTTYGEFGIVQSTVAMFAIFGGLALGSTASKFTAALKHSDPQRTGRILGFSSMVATITGSLVMLLVLLLADVLADRTLHEPRLARVLRIASPLLFLNAIAGVQNGALAGFEAFRKLSVWTSCVAAINATALVIGALVGGLSGAIGAMLVSNTIAVLIYRALLLSQCRQNGIQIQYKGAWGERVLLWSFALPAVLSGMLVIPVSWIANTILVNSTQGFDQMGLFNAANQWRTLLLFFPSIIAAPLLPVMCQLCAAGDFPRVKKLLLRCMGLNVALVGTLAVVIGLMGPYIMRLYGAGFEAGVTALWAMLGVAVLLSMGTVIGDLIVSTGVMWTGFIFNGVWAVILIAGAVALTPKYGAFGLALSYFIAYIIHTVIQLSYFAVRFRTSSPVQSARRAAQITPEPNRDV